MSFYGLIFKDRSLWQKFSLMTVLPLILVAAMLVLNIVGSVERSMMDEAYKSSRQLTDLTSMSMSSPNVLYNKSILDNFVTNLARYDDIVAAAVVDDSDGRYLANTNPALDGLVYDPGEFKKLAMTKNPSQAKTLVTVFSSPLIIDGKRYGELITAYSSARVTREVQSFRAKVMTATGLAMVLGLTLAVALARFLSSPVRNMSAQARKIGSGEYDLRVEYNSRDALGELAEAFNDMMVKLKDRKTQLETINNIAAQLHQSLRREEVTQKAVDILADYTNAPSVAVFLVDRDAGLLRLAANRDFGEKTLTAASVLPLDGSLSGLAVQGREVVVSEDISKDDRLEPNVKKRLVDEGFRGTVSIPLLYQEQVLGVMNLIFRAPCQISDGQIRTFMSVGRTLALALSNADYVARIEEEITERRRAEDALRHSIQEMTALNNLARTASLSMEVRAVSRSAVQSLTGALHPDTIIIWLLEQGRLEAKDVFSPNAPMPTEEHAIGMVWSDLCEKSLQTGRPIYICDLKDESRHRQGEFSESGLNSYAALPLLIGDSVIGVLGLGASETRDFSLETSFLETLAGQLAVALMNARQYEQIRRQAAVLEVRVAERTAELEVAMEKAMEADRIKSAFLASMSHELRTPLNSIIGFTGILFQELPGALNLEQKKQMGMVQSSARHLLDLINDVLDISKIEAGQLKLSREWFDFKESLDKVSHLVAPMAAKKGLRLIVDADEAVDRIRADRRRVEQILINLINNAIKFTDRGEVSVRAVIESDHIVTTVRDTGLGLRAEEMDTLFQEFRQLDSGLARRFEGTGLGLSICKKLVEMMGGDIRGESAGPGQGSSFTFKLPRDFEER